MHTVTLQKETSDNTFSGLRKLILYNSNHLWDDVINQLGKATGFDILRCEQIALFAHTKGKAVVKSGTADELGTINNVLREIDLITEIE
ncbi:MAG: ATP-dependent Clp protease adaptor ClpS [Ignavibacteria bacterium]|nr:ATP-dependent Clp protease adaptor ClpS [Ignavibacteria bacterium]